MVLDSADTALTGCRAPGAERLATLALGEQATTQGDHVDDALSIELTASALGGWLAPVFGHELRLGFDIDRIEGLAAEREALWSRVNAAGFLSDDEKREAVGYGAGG